MKKQMYLLVALLLISFFPINGYSAEVANTPQFKAGQYDPEGEVITVTAKGLVCEFCAKALEKVFMRRGDVAAINVDLTTKEILINLKKGNAIDDETISALITDSGYNINEIIRSKGDN